MLTKEFFQLIKENLDRIQDTQCDKIVQVSAKIVDTIENGNSVFVFGCTHAGILSQEMFYRTGGLAIINPLLPPGLTCDVRPITLTSQLERLEGLAERVLKNSPLKSSDLLIIHSVSGRNTVPVEMAIIAKQLGISTVAITNIEYSSNSKSRHPSGLRLFEACDIVIDNCGIFGDAALKVEGVEQKTAPTSTITGASIVNAIISETVQEFVNRDITPPIFISANIDGGDEHNKTIMEKYKNQIHYL